MISSTSGFRNSPPTMNDSSVPMMILLTTEAMMFSVSLLPLETIMSIEMRAENESTSALTVIMSISRLSFAPSRVNIG